MINRTGGKKFHNHCERCRYFHLKVQKVGGWLEICEVTDGWMDLCELCGERIDADGCKDDGWCYDGEKSPDNCPLMEVEDNDK